MNKNFLDQMLRSAKDANSKKILIAWNRGAGDIALGLYAIIYRIREYISDAEITLIVRKDLSDAAKLLENVRVISASFWRRNLLYLVEHTAALLGLDIKNWDLIIEYPDPTKWTAWQRGSLIPRLKWTKEYDELYKKFDLPKDKTLVAIQPSVETNHGPWREIPHRKWNKIFQSAKESGFLLFGKNNIPKYNKKNVIDLRGKTTFLEVLSIIKNCCRYYIGPDSGILSILYFLDCQFPIKVISIWGKERSPQGIMKQNVLSPNFLLEHKSFIFDDLQKLDEKPIVKELKTTRFGKELLKEQQRAFSLKEKKRLPAAPLLEAEKDCANFEMIGKEQVIKGKVGAIILAGGQGTRLNFNKPKGLFLINDKTLFQRSMEKVKNTQRLTTKLLYLAVMTSDATHLETIRYFEENDFFQMRRQVLFFKQKSYPFLDENKNWLKRGNEICAGPNGNGKLFQYFYQSGLFSFFQKQNIENIVVTSIDNLLSDPFDLSLIGYHALKDADITLLAIENDGKKRMGVIAKEQGMIKVLEYSEIAQEIQNSYKFVNVGTYCFNMKFIESIANASLPMHFTYKRVDNNSDTKGYKAEYFIFDLLDKARNAAVLQSDAKKVFFPIKDQGSLNQINLL